MSFAAYFQLCQDDTNSAASPGHPPAGDPAASTTFDWSGVATLVAGDNTSGYADGNARQARFADPFGIAVDKDGNLYVADAGDNNRIRRIAADGTVATYAGSKEGFADGPTAMAAFHTPSALALDGAGNLLIADTGNNAIRRITPQGIVTTVAGSGKPGLRDGPAAEAQFNGPVGLAADKQGNIYVADTYNDRIRMITPEGQVKTLAGGDRPGFRDGPGPAALFDTPCGIAVDAQGDLLIADTRNNAIRKLTKEAQVTTVALAADNERNGLLRRPLSLVSTHDGFLYIAEAARGRILQLSPTGELRALRNADTTDEPGASVRFKRPSGLALDKHGALYIADATARAIYRFAPANPKATKPTVMSAAVAADPAPISEAIPATEPHALRLPWPVQPQHGWHEVVGTMGEVRGNYNGESRDHFHGGVDIRATLGTPVLAIAAEKISHPIPNWGYGELNEGLSVNTLSYIHMRVGRNEKDAVLDAAKFMPLKDDADRLSRVRVKRGTRFAGGEQLGTVNRMYHVHLNFAPAGLESNPLALSFPGFSDRVAPRIVGIHLLGASGKTLTQKRRGRVLVTRAVADALDIVVDAYDQVDGNQARRRLGLYRLGYQILLANGTPAPGFQNPRINLEFNRLPADREAVKIAYAGDSGDIVHGASPTRFLYVVTNTVRDGVARPGSWRASELPPGDYVIRILAADYAGNEATKGRDLPVTIE